MPIQTVHKFRGRLGALVLSLAAPLWLASIPAPSFAQAVEQDARPVKDRNMDVSRADATKFPRSERDQAVVDGWPLYRTERGQAAFNAAMATQRATDGPAPSPQAFSGCTDLQCHLSLPGLSSGGWLQPGRIWVSPTDYVLIAHSPRLGEGRSYRRRSNRDMKVFVFHEFHNSSRNTDPFDTISSHKSEVFVPLYMSKQRIDAKGRRFVVVVQVAPHDADCIHATNHDSAGPGMEVAKNATDASEPLQELAGILVATIVKTAVPRLQVVNHHGAEGLAMLEAYERRLDALKARPGRLPVALPFVPATVERVATVTGRLEDLIAHGDGSVALRSASLAPAVAADATPRLIGPIRPAARPACATIVDAELAAFCRNSRDARP